MLVGVTATHPDLASECGRVGSALRAVGLSVESDAGAVDDPTGVEMLVCLIAPTSELLDDGTHYGERSVLAALDRDVPVLAYEVEANISSTEGGPLQGYAKARTERFRRRLREEGLLLPVREAAALPDQVLSDLEERSDQTQRTAEDSIRSLERRAREHPSPSYDSFTVSMHNVDQLFWVNRMTINREIPGEYRGAEAGGAGANAMVALRRLGMRTAVAGAVGDDAEGRMLRQVLDDDDIDTTLLLTARGATTGRSVMLRAHDGGYSNVIESGANARFASEVERRGLRRLLVDTAARSRILHLSSFATSSGREVQESLLRELPDQTLVSYKPGTMDASLGIDRLTGVLRRCDVLFLAETELNLLLEHLPEFDSEMRLGAKLNVLFGWRATRAHERACVIALIAGMDYPFQSELIRLYWGTTRQEGTVGPDPTVSGRFVTKDLAGARDAIVAGVLFGLLRARPAIDCANLAHVLAVSALEEQGCRISLPRATQMREKWRALVGGEPPRWLAPYG